MNAAHPEVVRQRLEAAGLLEVDQSLYGFSVVDERGQRVDPRSISASPEYQADYRTGPDLPSHLTMREFGILFIFVTRFAVGDGGLGEDEQISILVRDRGPGSTLPAAWIEFSVGERSFAFWRKTMDLYEVGPDGAVGDEPIHRSN